MDQKSQKEKASQRGQSGTEYDLSACDLAFLDALLHASPRRDVQEAIYGENQHENPFHLSLGAERLHQLWRSHSKLASSAWLRKELLQPSLQQCVCKPLYLDQLKRPELCAALVKALDLAKGFRIARS